MARTPGIWPGPGPGGLPAGDLDSEEVEAARDLQQAGIAASAS